MTTERHHEDIFGFDGSQGSPANLARLEHGQRVTQIESLSLGVTLGSVINRQSRDESVTDDCPRTRRPNAACSDNPNSGHDSRTIQTGRPSHSTNRCGARHRQRVGSLPTRITDMFQSDMYLSAATTCSTAPRLIAEKSKAASIWAHSPTTSQSCDRGGRSTLRQLGVDNSPPAWRAINTLTARPGEDQQL